MRRRRLERVIEEYDRVLAPAVRALGTRIRLSSIITAVEWQRHRVRIAIRALRAAPCRRF